MSASYTIVNFNVVYPQPAIYTVDGLVGKFIG